MQLQVCKVLFALSWFAAYFEDALVFLCVYLRKQGGSLKGKLAHEIQLLKSHFCCGKEGSRGRVGRSSLRSRKEERSCLAYCSKHCCLKVFEVLYTMTVTFIFKCNVIGTQLQSPV